MCHSGYYTLMRESKDPRYLRLRLVQQARRLGVKPTARLFGCAANTVRKWRRRFDGTLASLAEQSRAPHCRPRKLSPQAEAEILKAKRRLPVWGIARLKRDLQLPYSAKAIRRVLKQHDLLRRWRRKKHQTKRCLREVKKAWALWQQVDADTKDLQDLPEYWLQAKRLDLPAHQYTAREVSCGGLFLGYAQELALTYAELFARRIIEHLQAHGVKLPEVTVQSDNGSEFIGSWQAKEPSAFTRTIEEAGARHKTIPPGAHRFQADVETVHGLMETEFYLERFRDRQDFLQKATTYQHFFNYVRLNSAKENKAPWDLVQEKLPDARPSLLYLPPVFLEDLLHQRLYPSGVHDVGVHPCSRKIPLDHIWQFCKITKDEVTRAAFRTAEAKAMKTGRPLAVYRRRARVLKALAHPARLMMVDELARGERCVCELTRLVGADISTVSRHLALLREAGLVSDEKRGQQVFYSLRAPCVLRFFGCIEAVARQAARAEAALAR